MTPYGSLKFSCMRAQTRNQFRKKGKGTCTCTKIKLAKSCIYVFIEIQEHSNEYELPKALKGESSSYNEDPTWIPSFGHESRSLKRPSQKFDEAA